MSELKKSGNDVDAKKYDKAMKATSAATTDLTWHDPTSAPFRLVGFPWFEKDQVFRRMPLSPSQTLPPSVDNLAWHTTGGQVHFRSDTKCLTVRVKLRDDCHMIHMPQTGMSGFDLYIGEPCKQQYYHTTKFELGLINYENVLFDHQEKKTRSFTLNFPLYNGVENLEIGLSPEATLETFAPFDDDRPVIIYGTSITHGGCASRPGNAYPNILSRRINLPFVNLGFSGSGLAEG